MTKHPLADLRSLNVDQLGRPLTKDGFDAICAGIPEWHPRNEGDPDPAPPNPDPAPDPAPTPDPAPAPEPVDDVAKLREELQKHRRTERRAKAAEQEANELKARLKEIEEANASEQEKAIAKARKEGEDAATSRYEEQRRDDKIEAAVTKLALKGFTVKVKDGDEEKEQTLRFADPDDAQLRLERAIRSGDLSYDDIYTDGKVQTDAVSEFLRETLDANEHLRARDSAATAARPAGGADAGKGAPRDAGASSVEEDLRKIRRNK